MEYRIIIPDTKEEEALDDALMAYNLRQVPPLQKEPFIKICRCAKTKSGEILGGILACAVLWNILHIETLWVDEAFRGKRIASRLLEETENEAKRQGCYMATLNTYDFQARPFYEKRGYRLFGVLEDAPKGHSQYFLYKNL